MSRYNFVGGGGGDHAAVTPAVYPESAPKTDGITCHSHPSLTLSCSSSSILDACGQNCFCQVEVVSSVKERRILVEVEWQYGFLVFEIDTDFLFIPIFII